MDDRELQQRVAEELEWAPHVDASGVNVEVRNGIVRLTGAVSSLAEKKAAERAVWHVRGVRGIAEEIEVVLPEALRCTDEQIAHRVARVLDWDTQIPGERIQIQVERGVVTLIGAVDWQYQRTEAEERVHKLAGVIALDNRIVVRSPVSPSDIKERVQRAFHRHAKLHTADISLQVNDRKVTLIGRVPSVDERETAENAAWSAAGVEEVKNLLVVEPQG